MKRRGFVLISVLWTLVILSGIGLAALEGVKLGSRLTSNRTLLARADWARAACAEILRARFAADARRTRLDTVDLGRGTWCKGRLVDPSRRLNLNLAGRERLLRLFGADSLVAAFSDWIDSDTSISPGGAERPWYRAHHRIGPRNAPLAGIEELHLIRGFDSALVQRVAVVADVVGDGVSLLQDQLPAPSSLLLAEVSGGVRGTTLVSHGRIAYRLAGHRLATLWQELP